MFTITVKNLRARKLRLVTTGMAVLIGVAFMAGTMVLTDTVTATFNDLFADVSAGVDVQVRAAPTIDQPELEVRSRIDESLVATVAAVDGVEAVSGVVQGFTQLSDAEGNSIGDPSRGPPTFGMSWTDDAKLNPFRIAEGRAPSADTEIVIDRGSAKKGNLHVGDVTHVDAAKPVPPLTIVGITTFGNADSPLGASFVGFTLPGAQRYIAEPGKLDAISVRSSPGLSEEELRGRVAAALPPGLEARTGAEVTVENQNDMKESLSFFSTFMLTFALIALFVGSFIIHNTFSILIAQRTREVALLRAVGASSRQILGGVMVESVAVGVVASALGVVAGIAVAGLLKSLLAAVGLAIPAGGIVMTPRTILVSLVTGTVVTILAALLPARRAARITPMAALSDAAVESDDHLLRRTIIGSVVTAAGAGLGAYGLFVSPANAAAFVGIGGAAWFVGLGILGPLFARPLAALIGRPAPAVRGIPGTLAVENAMRNPRRTSSTAAALTIGVALVAFISIFATSTKKHINDVVGEQFAADFVVQSGTWGFGGMDPTLTAAVAGLPEVAAASGSRIAPMRVEGQGVMGGAVDPIAFPQVLDIGVEQGAIENLGVDGIAVRSLVAEERDLQIGDPLAVAFAKTGSKTLTVRAIYEEVELVPDYLVSTATHDANFDNRFDTEIYVKRADGVSMGDAKAAIERAVADQQNAKVVDRQGYIDDNVADVNQLLSLIYVLLALAILIAVLGIANTLALSIHERTRELGLLRAVGMTRSQLRTAVRWESLIIALLGAALGLGVGVVFGWAMVMSVADDGLKALAIPYGQLLFITALAALCGVLAAIRPARRAAKLDVLAAIATA